jgi:hypothetical protein
VHEPLAALFELIRHVVEGVDGTGHFVARLNARLRAGLQPPRPVSAGVIGERGGEILDRPADPVGDENQRQQRDEPGRAEQHEQRQRESSPQVACIDRVDEAARSAKLSGQLFHADATQIAAVDLDARAGRIVHPAHVVHALAVRSRYAETLALAALPERSNGLGPRCRVRRREHGRGRPPRERVQLQRVAFALVELLRGGLERP